MASPASRSIAYLKSKGYHVHKTEYWNSFARKRIDFGGFADAIAYSDFERGCLAINFTTTGNISGHIKKYETNDNLKAWFRAGNRFVIHGWAKRGPRGKRKIWTLKEVFLPVS